MVATAVLSLLLEATLWRPLRAQHAGFMSFFLASIGLALVLRQALLQAELNFELTVAGDGAEALDFIRKHPVPSLRPGPDLIVLDLNLPKNGGIEVLEAIRGNKDLSALSVAVMTSSFAPQEKARVERLQVDRFITKPPDLEEFLRIGAVLKQLLLERASRSAGDSVR